MIGSVERYTTNGKPRWRLRWLAHGQRMSQSFTSHAELVTFRRELAMKRAGGVKKTISWLIDEFIAYKRDLAERGQLEHATADDYEFALRRWVGRDAKFASIKLSELDAVVVREFFKRLVGANSDSAVRRARTHTSVMLGWAVENGWLSINPVRDVKLKLSQRHAVQDDLDRLDWDDIEITRLTIPTPGEVRSILASADRLGIRSSAMVRLLFFGGLRVSEMLGLPINAVRREEGGCVTIKIVQRAASKRPVVGRLKNRGSRRQITVAPEAGNALSEYLLSAGVQQGLVFGTSNGTPLLYKNFHARIWKPVLGGAGLAKPVSPHDARHFAISALIAAGTQPKEIQAFAGHATLQITMDTYGHLFPSELRDIAIADAIAKQIGG